MTISQQDYIQREIAVWGEAEVFAMLDAGYEPIELVMPTGQTRWSWVLTAPRECAIVGSGGTSTERTVTPVSVRS